MFWRKAKEIMLYTIGWKHPQPPRVWKGQVVRLFYSKVGGAIDREIILVILHKKGENKGIVVLKTWSSRTLSGCLDAKVGGVTE